jgi:hypothetical protein
MKQDSVTKYDAFMWNRRKSATNDDGIFITSCMNPPLLTRFDGLLLKSDGSWVHNSYNSKVVLDLLMVHSTKYVGLKTIQPMGVGLMSKRRFIV